MQTRRLPVVTAQRCESGGRVRQRMIMMIRTLSPDGDEVTIGCPGDIPGVAWRQHFLYQALVCSVCPLSVGVAHDGSGHHSAVPA